MTGIRQTMAVMKQNMDKATELHIELAYAVHERVTDCWSDEQAQTLDARILQLSQSVKEKLAMAASMCDSFK